MNEKVDAWTWISMDFLPMILPAASPPGNVLPAFQTPLAALAQAPTIPRALGLGSDAPAPNAVGAVPLGMAFQTWEGFHNLNLNSGKQIGLANSPNVLSYDEPNGLASTPFTTTHPK